MGQRPMADCARLEAIPGIGAKRAQWLVAELPRILESSRAAAAWAGVAPRLSESGTLRNLPGLVPPATATCARLFTSRPSALGLITLASRSLRTAWPNAASAKWLSSWPFSTSSCARPSPSSKTNPPAIPLTYPSLQKPLKILLDPRRYLQRKRDGAGFSLRGGNRWFRLYGWRVFNGFSLRAGKSPWSIWQFGGYAGVLPARGEIAANRMAILKLNPLQLRRSAPPRPPREFSSPLPPRVPPRPGRRILAIRCSTASSIVFPPGARAAVPARD